MRRLSLLTIANGHGGTVTRLCGMCQQPCRVPIQDLVLVWPPDVQVEWEIDVGGYCATCSDFRCEQHIVARDAIDRKAGGADLPIVELFCQQCGQRVGAPPRVPVDHQRGRFEE